MLETVILSNLVGNEQYARKVLPFLKGEYFNNPSEHLTFTLIEQHIKKYNSFPSKGTLLVELDDVELNGDQFEEAQKVIKNLDLESSKDEQWLLDKTEQFCQEKAIMNAIHQGIKILDGREKNLTISSLPEILKDAIAVSFDTHVGHDYLEDWEHRYDFYHTKESKVPFHLKLMNEITRGGVAKKSLNVILAGTGGFKTGFMCDAAAHNLQDGLNVLYITMEMSEERIAERIDANLLDIPIEDLETLPRDVFIKRLQRVKDKTRGKLIIKEYPTASAGASHFRYLLNEMRLKRNFVPDIIYIDYINICCSTRLKLGSSVNSYSYVKAIAEELRGLAVEFNVPIITATQTNREGFTSSDPGLENTSESFGLPQTADLMYALVQTEELASLNQIMVKQLKNRYSDPDRRKRFVVGVDKSKMRLYDVEDSAQTLIGEDKPVFDASQFGAEDEERIKPIPRGKKKVPFKGFK